MAVIIPYATSVSGTKIKSNQVILLDLADLALQAREQPEENLMEAIFRAWYNGSYFMAVKPVKSAVLYYNQFLINLYILWLIFLS